MTDMQILKTFGPLDAYAYFMGFYSVITLAIGATLLFLICMGLFCLSPKSRTWELVGWGCIVYILIILTSFRLDTAPYNEAKIVTQLYREDAVTNKITMEEILYDQKCLFELMGIDSFKFKHFKTSTLIDTAKTCSYAIPNAIGEENGYYCKRNPQLRK